MSGKNKGHLQTVEQIAESIITGKPFKSVCGEVVAVTRESFVDPAKKVCQDCYSSVAAMDDPTAIHPGLTLEALFELVLKRQYEARPVWSTYKFTLGPSSLTAWPDAA